MASPKGGKKTANRQSGPGRPKGPSEKTIRRGRFARAALDAGMPEEIVLSVIAKRLIPPAAGDEKTRQKIIRKHLDRFQIDATGGKVQRDSAARTRAARDYRQLESAGDTLRAAQRSAGIRTPPPKVGENCRAQRRVADRDPEAALGWINAEIDYLSAYGASMRSEAAANVTRVPRGFPDANEAELEHRQQTLRELADEVRAQRDAPLKSSLGLLRELHFD